MKAGSISIDVDNLGHLRANSPHAMLIESSFCGPKPIPTASMDVAEEAISLSSAVRIKVGERTLSLLSLSR